MKKGKAFFAACLAFLLLFTLMGTTAFAQTTEDLSDTPEVIVVPEPSDSEPTKEDADGESSSDGTVTTNSPSEESTSEDTQESLIKPAASYDFTAPVLTSFDVLTPEVTAPGTLSIQFGLVEEETGVDTVAVYYKAILPDGRTREESFFWNAHSWNESGQYIRNPLFSGQHVLTFPISSSIGALHYELSSVFLWDGDNNRAFYSLNSSKTALNLRLTNDPGPDVPCNPNLVVTSSGDSADITAPVLTSFNVLTPEVTAPGTFSVEFGLVEEETGIETISIYYSATLPDGRVRTEYFFGMPAHGMNLDSPFTAPFSAANTPLRSLFPPLLAL